MVPVAVPEGGTPHTCSHCSTDGVVVWNDTPLCSECFLAASIQHATGREDLYLTLRTLPPRAAEHVIRAILRQVKAKSEPR